jgi:hypothetical protein
MRGTARRIWAAGLATAVLAAGAAACSGGGANGDGRSGGTTGKTVVQACAGGTFTWSGITKTDRLTGVSEVQRIGAGGGGLTNRLRRVYTPGPSVRTEGPSVSAAEVLYSLGKKIGEIDSDAPALAKDDSGTTYVFADPKAEAPRLESGFTRVDGSGEFVTYTGVREVTGDFRYACPGGRTTTGHAGNRTGDLDGLLNCEESVDRNALARPAARRSCASGSAATRQA